MLQGLNDRLLVEGMPWLYLTMEKIHISCITPSNAYYSARFNLNYITKGYYEQTSFSLNNFHFIINRLLSERNCKSNTG